MNYRLLGEALHKINGTIGRYSQNLSPEEVHGKIIHEAELSIREYDVLINYMANEGIDFDTNFVFHENKVKRFVR